jgi:UDP-glucose 4-epimerase
MRVLVTGGAGYIGSHTLLELLSLNHEVCVVDNYENSSPEVLNRVSRLSNQTFEFHDVDIRNEASLGAIFKDFQPDAVIHFAGLKAVGESAEKPLHYYDTNINGTLSLLRAMDSSGCKRIIFSSSATVYGEAKYLPYDEAHPCAPTNVYGRTKHMAELILEDWHHATANTSVVLLRYFNPVGAHNSGQLGEDPKGIPNNLMPFISQVAVGRRKNLSVFGDDYDTKDGTGQRDYIHVVDLASAHIAAIDYAEKTNSFEAFNIGTGEGYTVLEMIKAFSRASSCDIPYEIINRREGDVASSLANPNKANNVLKWSAKMGLDEMCESVWLWQSQNPNGYNEI